VLIEGRTPAAPHHSGAHLVSCVRDELMRVEKPQRVAPFSERRKCAVLAEVQRHVVQVDHMQFSHARKVGQPRVLGWLSTWVQTSLVVVLGRGPRHVALAVHVMAGMKIIAPDGRMNPRTRAEDVQQVAHLGPAVGQSDADLPSWERSRGRGRGCRWGLGVHTPNFATAVIPLQAARPKTARPAPL
jgi:hypothetical protein